MRYKKNTVYLILVIVLFLIISVYKQLSSSNSGMDDGLVALNDFKKYNDLKVTHKIESMNEHERDFNIFFVETNEYRKSFGIRSLCAIESTAKHNPNARVIVKALSAKIDVPEILSQYPNIEWSLLDLNETFKDTPLMEWWLSGRLVKNNNYTRFAHLADALRYTLVYKYGGLYTDLDTITLKNFKPLTKYSGFGGNRDDPKGVISNGFFHFTKKHPFLLEALKEVPKIYQPDWWGTIGPLLIRPLVRRYCNVSNFDELMHMGIHIPEVNMNLKNPENDKTTSPPPPIHPCGITVFPYYLFYPYQLRDLGDLFRHNGSIPIYKLIHTFSLHFFGRLTMGDEVSLNEYSVFEFFAAFNCPLTHQVLKANSIIKNPI